MFKRNISELFDFQLKRKDIILLFGARQTGKSTLLEILSQKHNSFKILNCEQSIISDTLREMNIPKIIALFDSHEIIAFDEAQTIPEIGKILKLLFDDKKIDTKFIATGSSSFELSNKTGEPLTGRNISFKLFPLSINEISEKKGWQFVLENLHELLIMVFTLV